MKKSKILRITALFAIVLLVAAAFGEYRYYDGLSKGFELGKMTADAKANDTSEPTRSGNTLQDALNSLTAPATSKATTNEYYTGPEAWMLNPVGRMPFWVERTDAEALALELSSNATVEMVREYSRKDLSTSVPLSADESFHLNLLIDDEVAEEKLHEMNCYYPKHVAAGETFEIRVVLEEENGKVYVGSVQLTAGDEDLNLTHGDSNPDAWYGAGRVGYNEITGAFVTYFYTGATDAHWERPMFAGITMSSGALHCNYHCLESTVI